MSFTKKQLEQLPPSQLQQQLYEHVAHLNAVLDIKLKALKKAPEGTLRISSCRGVIQYYHRQTPEDSRGTYITAANQVLAQKLAQKDYNRHLVKSLKKEIRLLQTTLTQLQKMEKSQEAAHVLIKSFHPLRQTLIIPVTLSNEQYAAAWLAQKYKGRSFAADTPPLLTSKGECVRSKSEMLIADTLARMGVPYHYEYPLTLNDNGHTFTMNPDFLCLNLRTRQEFIWEHFGMMDDAAYSSKTVKKLRTYAQNGIYPGHNLITTAETTELPLNTRYLEKIITEYLK